MFAWLTKNNIPSGRVEYVLSLPDDETWRADFLGALFLLTQPQNWELDQGLTPQEMADEWEKVFYDFNEGVFNLIPIGSILPFASDSIPGGWLLCDGAAISRTTYAALFSVIGTTFGSGSGGVTFNLPQMGLRVPVGNSAVFPEFGVLGDSGGEHDHTLTIGEIPSHNHVENAHTHIQNAHTHIQDQHAHTVQVNGVSVRNGATSGSGSNNVNNTNGNNTGGFQWLMTSTTPTNQNATPTNQNATPTNQNTGSGSTHNNMQPYLILNYIIKY